MALACLCLAGSAPGAWQDDVGYTALKAELGPQTPDGTGMTVTQVEGDESGSSGLHKYVPDVTSSEFLGKTITDVTGLGGASIHATRVGNHIYGLTLSMAPGITLIDAYENVGWWGDDFLRVQGSAPPRPETRRIQNHSWIGNFVTNSANVDALRRLDLVVERDGVVVCAGVNNYDPQVPSTRNMPRLMCSAYNCIAVGLANGNASYGPTLVEVAGRCKPDLVAVATNQVTSYATGVVSSAAAVMLAAQEAGGALSELPARRRRVAQALLTKALLMAGAVKPTGWRKGFATPSTDGSVPLDYRYGAGTLNVAESYHILAAGRFPAAAAPAPAATSVGPATGWDYADLAAGQTRYYFIEVPAGQVAARFSAMLVWNRKIAAPPDLDRDDDVDFDDLTLFQSCLTGPSVTPTPPGCEEVDFDGDGDGDQSDFGRFQVCLSGPGNPPAVACRGGLAPSLANLDLALRAAPGLVPGALIESSVSVLDNVEHVYQLNLPAGTYALAVSANAPGSYALAWNAALAAAP
ncbi:MAG: hypothetical protein AMXMBFR83_11790 [Phycisphaerae bacterium]